MPNLITCFSVFPALEYPTTIKHISLIRTWEASNHQVSTRNRKKKNTIKFQIQKS